MSEFESAQLRSLLVRYIEHVYQCEGTMYLADHYRPQPNEPTAFTDAEWDFLQTLADEL